jgi:hypothetical protein
MIARRDKFPSVRKYRLFARRSSFQSLHFAPQHPNIHSMLGFDSGFAAHVKAVRARRKPAKRTSRSSGCTPIRPASSASRCVCWPYDRTVAIGGGPLRRAFFNSRVRRSMNARNGPHLCAPVVTGPVVVRRQGQVRDPAPRQGPPASPLDRHLFHASRRTWPRFQPPRLSGPPRRRSTD